MPDTHEVTLLLTEWAKGNQRAQTLDVSPITVRRDLRMTEAWLHQEIKDS